MKVRILVFGSQCVSGAHKGTKSLPLREVETNKNWLLCGTFFKGMLMLFMLVGLKMPNNVMSLIGFEDMEQGGCAV